MKDGEYLKIFGGGLLIIILTTALQALLPFVILGLIVFVIVYFCNKS